MKHRIFLIICICLINGLHAQHAFREKVYVHTDKNHYHSGETMWFRMLVVNTSSNKFTDLSKVAYLELLDSVGRPVTRGMVLLQNGTGNGTMNIPAAPAGVYTLIAYTNWMKNFPASNYFQMPIALVNGLESAINFIPDARGNSQEINRKIGLQTSDAEYDTRSLVSIDISAITQTNSLPQIVSLSVFKIDDPTLAGSFAAIGMAGATQVINNSSNTGSPAGGGMMNSEVTYLPEYNGRIVTGRIIHKESGEPVKGKNILLSVVGTPGGFYNGISDEAGKFLIEVRHLEGCDSIIARSDNADSLFKITIDSPFQTEFEVTPTNSFRSITGDSTALMELSINSQVQDVYYPDPPLQSEIFDSILFFGLADYSYLLDDFTRFSKMEEVFREYVAPVAVIRKAGIPFLRVYVPGEHATYNNSPLVLLDGYPVLNIIDLFTFDPLKVKKINVVTRRFFRNGIVYDGVVYLTTYSGNMNDYPIDPRATVITDQAVLGERQFIAPRYESTGAKHNRLPDFRTLLYWSADVEGNRIEFYSSDVEGTFMAFARGVTDNGETASGWTTFSVKKKPNK